MATMRPSLMFGGKAEEAVRFYVSLFEDGEILKLLRYGGGKEGAKGALMHGEFRIAGQTVLCCDGVAHAFAFTPAISLTVDCGSEAEHERLTAALAEGGETLLPPDDYGFSKRFTWVTDRYGVTWQLNLP